MSFVDEVRFNTHIPGLTNPGEKIVKRRTADMFHSDGMLLVRTRSAPPKCFVIPFERIDYMLVREINFGVEPEREEEAPAPMQAPEPPPTAPQLVKPPDDTVRMVRIKGKIVERRGPPKDDELEELTRPKAKTLAEQIAQAEDDEE